MISYRDMTFCSFYKKCAEKDCARALTKEINGRARKFGLPICRFMGEPPCFRSK